MNPTADPSPATGTASLAIIVPAYKPRFLREALESIARQTDKNFQLYVFNDNGPEAIEEIVSQFKDRLPLKYHRFPENLGGTSLARHWDRCINLTGEKWIWVFSDDDVMDEGCVRAFFEELSRTQEAHDLYRFNTVLVNASGVCYKESPRHPDQERGSDFLMARWRGERDSFLQGAIFSRKAWAAIHGIPDYPLGWHSDDALITLLGTRCPIKTMAGPRVSWRMSDINITSSGSAALVPKKITASAKFIRWAVNYFEDHSKNETPSALKLSEAWFFVLVTRFWCFLGWRTCREIDSLASDVWGYRRGAGLWKGIKLNCNIGAEKITRNVRKVFKIHAKNSVPDKQ